jgi:hypothetical protein
LDRCPHTRAPAARLPSGAGSGLASSRKMALLVETVIPAGVVLLMFVVGLES